MKITFEWPFKTFSGTQQEMTYMSYRKGNLCLGRGWSKPDATASQAVLAGITHNLKRVWDEANPDYKEDLKLFAKKFKTQKLRSGQFPPAAFGIFINMMYAWHRSAAEQVNLSTVTVQDIVNLNAPVQSVTDAVTSQLLVPVSGYELLCHEIG